MAFHVLPINDINPHEEVGTSCPCEPRVIFEGGEMIIIHNSFDGREGLEQANDILNNETKK